MVVGMLQDMRKAPQSFGGANDSSPIAGVTKTVQHNAESCHPGGADIFQPREPLRRDCHCRKVVFAGPRGIELESTAGSLERTDSAA